MKQFITLIKREFWEHKKSTFYAPLIISVGFIILFLFSGIQSKAGVSALKAFSFGLSIGTMPSILMLVIPVIIVIYAMTSLYEERKNKSLLFWRSMPVSDTKTVFSKVFFGVIVIPLLFIITWFVVANLSFVINYSMAHFSDVSDAPGSKHEFELLIGFVSAISLGFLVLSIMMLPYFTYLTFISSISNRVPFLIAILPFIALAFINMLIPESLLLYDYIFMPLELAIGTSLEVTKTTFEGTGLISLFSERQGFSMQEYQDFFNDAYKEMGVSLKWDSREIYTLLASIISSVIFITLAIFSRKRIQAV